MSVRPDLVGNRYRLREPLGVGGMGRVWRARDESLGRDVAIKLIQLPNELIEQHRDVATERALREARAAARLNHPNVVRVYDVLKSDDQPWLVMEYVPSRSLQEVVTQDGPLAPRRAAEIGLDVLSALRAAHRSGVQHRDIKPSNVLLTEDGRVVLTDFGIATIEGDTYTTRSGLVLGSPEYIAPERAKSGTAGPAADLWSLGATLYFAVEGRSPFQRNSAIETLSALATENHDPIKRAGPLTPVIEALLRKNPEARAKFAEIERLLRAVTVVPPPRTAPPRVPKQRRWLWSRSAAPSSPPAPSSPAVPSPPAPSSAAVASSRAVPSSPAAAVAAVVGRASVAAPVAPEVEPADKPDESVITPVSESAVEAPERGVEEASAATMASVASPVDESVASPVDASVAETSAPPSVEEPIIEEADESTVTESPVDAGTQASLAQPVEAPDVERTDEPATTPAPPVPATTRAEPFPGARASAPVLAPETGLAVGEPAADPSGKPPNRAGRRRLLIGAVAATIAIVLVVSIVLLTNRKPAHNPAVSSPTTAPGTTSAPTAAATTGKPSVATSTAAATAPPANGGSTAQARTLPPLPAGWVDYHDPTGFSVYVPANWRRSKERSIMYFRGDGRVLGIDQTNQPRWDPVADWRNQSSYRVSHGDFPNYHEIKIAPVKYFITAADWEFTFDGNGRQHVNNRGVVVSSHQAYGFYWQTADAQWAAARPDLQRVFDSFRPAA